MRIAATSAYIPVLRFSVYLQNLRPQVSPLRSEKFCHLNGLYQDRTILIQGYPCAYLTRLLYPLCLLCQYWLYKISAKVYFCMFLAVIHQPINVMEPPEKLRLFVEILRTYCIMLSMESE